MKWVLTTEGGYHNLLDSIGESIALFSDVEPGVFRAMVEGTVIEKEVVALTCLEPIHPDSKVGRQLTLLGYTAESIYPSEVAMVVDSHGLTTGVSLGGNHYHLGKWEEVKKDDATKLEWCFIFDGRVFSVT